MKDLHKEFIKLGNDRRKLTNQLLAILPEIFEKQIYKKYAATIVEYAGKFGGLSAEVVKKRLRLEKYLKDKPKLRELIASEGVHKVSLVASLATVEDEAAWADKVKNMSKPAIQELSKEVRWKREMGEASYESVKNSVNLNLFTNNQGVIGSGNFAEGSYCKSTLCSAAPQQIKINLEGELFFMFLKLKKKYGEILTNQEVMKKIFEENLGGNFCKKFQNADEKRNANEVEIQERVEEIKVVENVKIPCPQSVKVIPGDNFVQNKFRYRFEE